MEACVSCQTYDPQCEERRAPWLVSIAGRANLNAKLVQAINAKNQGTPTESHRDIDQRCDILQELAAAGSGEARQLLYASLTRLDRSDVIGDSQIVSLDGVDGLIRVARQLGQWLRSDPEFWVDDHLIAHVTRLRAAGVALLLWRAQPQLMQISRVILNACGKRASFATPNPQGPTLQASAALRSIPTSMKTLAINAFG